MKKYLLLGFAALAFVSCSKDNFSSSDIPASYKDASAVVSEYGSNFEKTFGTPDANQTWGFGSASAAAKAMRRANAVVDGDPFTFENTDTYYKTVIPSTAKSPEEAARPDWGEGKYDENAYQSWTEMRFEGGTEGKTFGVHLWGGSRDIYVSGKVTFNVDNTNSLNQARIYVLPGATLNFNMTEYINNLEIYVAANGTLNYNAPQLYKQTGGGKIYNRGTVNFMQDTFQYNQDAIVYNEGTVTGKDFTSAPGDGHKSFFYNFGDLTLTGKMVLNSCAHFYNGGNVKVTGETNVTQTNIYWINKGHYETNSLIFSAKNSTFYNFCQLLVKTNAHMYDGEFNLMPNSYTEAATADMDNFIVNMYGDAGINIKGAVDIAAQGDGTFQGFKCKAGDDNYVLIGGKVTIASHKETLTIEEGITYSIKEIEIIKEGNVVTEEQLKANSDGDYPVTVLNAESGVAYGKLTVTPKTTGCGATWTTGTVPPAVKPSLHVMAEDLSATDASDFDFNDVVFDVFYKDAKTVTIKLLAAGGTVPLRICENDNWEVHKLFNVATTCMVNTGTKYHTAKAPYTQVDGKDAVELEYELTEGTWSMDQDEFAVQVRDLIKLEVNKGGWFVLTAEQGKPACKIATPVTAIDTNWYPTDYKWPYEKQNIGDDFKNWVENPTEKWYTTRKSLKETNEE